MMTDRPVPAPPRTWDGRLARWLVAPLRDTGVTPNHLTTLRLTIGVAGAAGLAAGSYRWVNIGALLIVLSNFVDHTDGELARISGKTSRFGHYYDLASDAIVTILLFTGLGVGVGTRRCRCAVARAVSPVMLGAVTGVAVALIFFLRMRTAALLGIHRVAQSFAHRLRDRRRAVPVAARDAVQRRRAVPRRRCDRIDGVRRLGGGRACPRAAATDHRRVEFVVTAFTSCRSPAAGSGPRCAASTPTSTSIMPSTRSWRRTLSRLDGAARRDDFRRQGSFVSLATFLPADVTASTDRRRTRTAAAREPQLSAGPQEGGERQSPHDRPARAVDRRALSLEGAARVPRSDLRRGSVAVPARRPARLRALLLHEARRPYRLALRHVVLRRPPLHGASRRDRRVVVPARLRTAHARGRRRRGRGRVHADSARRPRVLRRRQACVIASRRRPKARRACR